MSSHGEIPDPLHHVKDTPQVVIFDRLADVHFDLPKSPEFEIFGYRHQFQLTKFMILELMAAVLILAIFIPLAQRIKSGQLPTGKFWNFFESFLTFIRNDIARPNFAEKDADRFVPYLWTIFLFILFMNLLGMIPWLGSPTANISVTGVLAICSFALLHLVPIIKFGPIRYFKSMWIETGMPWWTVFPILISLLILLIELLGTVIKGFVLAVRLFANMFAGHLVLAIILTFVVAAGHKGYSHIWPVVTTASVLGVVALSLLELFVAFLQAYVFTFLTAIFIGSAIHHCEEHDHGNEAEHRHEAGHGHGAEPAHGHGP